MIVGQKGILWFCVIKRTNGTVSNRWTEKSARLFPGQRSEGRLNRRRVWEKALEAQEDRVTVGAVGRVVQKVGMVSEQDGPKVGPTQGESSLCSLRARGESERTRPQADCPRLLRCL